MMDYKKTVLALLAFFFCSVCVAQHPQVYVQDADKPAILQKIQNYPWAKESLEGIKKSVDKYVSIHEKDPQWIISRLAMYWKPGQHYTQCYINNETWDYGEGNAPVPTVRLPGMRTWNEYNNVPLEDRIPFNESGDMLGVSKKSPSYKPVLVSYKKSGHLIRGNNAEILNLAQRAAFVYWVTGDEKYARFATDIFNTWLIGTYYMEPPLDPSHRSGGPGGYAPGGIMGYYDYEQIHDNLCFEAVPTYDLLFGYLKAHPSEAMKAIGKPLETIAATVFKRFVEIGMVRGGNKGNWNVNGWDIMMPGILALETNSFYPDGKGREYYLKFYTDNTTKYHDALPDILRAYSPVTGLWGEAPGYGLGTIASVLEMALPIYKNGVNTIGSNPMIQKSTLAIIPWLDARGNMVLFGDMRGGPGNYTAFERLLTYFQWVGDTAGVARISAVIQQGIDAKQYDRGKDSWKGLCYNLATLKATKTIVPYARAAYSEVHRHITMKNGNDTTNGLMFTLYGGYHRNLHLSPNGLAMQLYGKGWALSPDAAGYESYWSDDYNYHQSATGSNTILPGYTAGAIKINAMEPAVDSGSFTSNKHISENVSFADVSAGEKRRMVAMVRTSATTGFYVDIFRSDLNDNDYLYHNLGNNLSFSNGDGSKLDFAPTTDLGNKYNKAYSYFRDVTKAPLDNDLKATWTITKTNPTISMDMWMLGAKSRELYNLIAPYTSNIYSVTPNKVNAVPDSTHAIIVRQTGSNAWKTPFVTVFEPYSGNDKSINTIKSLAASAGFNALQIESKPLNKDLQGRKETVLYGIDDSLHTILDMGFKGLFGVISEQKGGVVALYLGKGKLIGYGGYEIQSVSGKDISAGLVQSEGHWYYSADAAITIAMPRKGGLGVQYMSGGVFVKANSGMLPAGYDVEIRMDK
ncbi:hypothetical protein [Parasediminibacterium sp. JCM 36343]|uniref:hypothetical protein n=1 Tax=Parasediminibacterium sp. JCM 36343 TaxID=3374279 RepID=UPI00397C3C83